LKITLGLIPALIAVSLGYVHATAQQPSLNVPPSERQVLMEFYSATGGPRWKKHDGWGTSASVCDWYGVFCNVIDGDQNRPFVAGLSLDFNNLEGRIPASLGNLTRLQSLSVAGNRLSGTVPQPLLQRWDDHAFEFDGDGNVFSDFVVRVSIRYSASGVLCSEYDDLDFRAELDGISRRATFQSIRCAAPGSRTTYCLVREGTPGSLTRLSRELKALRFASFEPKYDYPFSGVTHGVYLTTTAAWGDRSRKSVETYNRQGPRDVWVAQQLFLGLLTEASWERETRKPKCDFEK
jgi:Leucine Rich Repeat (LRR) protein